MALVVGGAGWLTATRLRAAVGMGVVVGCESRGAPASILAALLAAWLVTRSAERLATAPVANPERRLVRGMTALWAFDAVLVAQVIAPYVPGPFPAQGTAGWPLAYLVCGLPLLGEPIPASSTAVTPVGLVRRLTGWVGLLLGTLALVRLPLGPRAIAGCGALVVWLTVVRPALWPGWLALGGVAWLLCVLPPLHGLSAAAAGLAALELTRDQRRVPGRPWLWWPREGKGMAYRAVLLVPVVIVASVGVLVERHIAHTCAFALGLYESPRAGTYRVVSEHGAARWGKAAYALTVALTPAEYQRIRRFRAPRRLGPAGDDWPIWTLRARVLRREPEAVTIQVTGPFVERPAADERRPVALDGD